MKREEHVLGLCSIYKRADRSERLRSITDTITGRSMHRPISFGLEARANIRLSPKDKELRERALQVVSESHLESVSDSDLEALEAVVHQQMRPAILVQDGRPVALPADWSHLAAHEESIKRAIASTGRIEIHGDPGLAWIGTGFVIDNNLVATNRHVLQEAAFLDHRHGWQFRQGVSLRVDFAEEIGGVFSHEVSVTGIWGVHSHYDIAILEMDAGCPPPLYYSPRPAKAGQEVITIGYPAFDSRRNDAAVMNQIFKGIYDVKRLMPGELMPGSADPYLVRHDCSTLGGNSGSPVIEPQSGHVIGIHFKGFYLRWNEAVDFTPNYS
jgi:hypothetical protein